MLNYPFDPGIAAVLPLLPSELGTVVLRSRGQALGPNGFLDFRIRDAVVTSLYNFHQSLQLQSGDKDVVPELASH